MALRRELRYIYCAIFKLPGQQTDIRELISFYDEYNTFRKRMLDNKVVPSTIKTQLLPIKVPQYMAWVKQFVKDNK